MVGIEDDDKILDTTVDLMKLMIANGSIKDPEHLAKAIPKIAFGLFGVRNPSFLALDASTDGEEPITEESPLIDRIEGALKRAAEKGLRARNLYMLFEGSVPGLSSTAITDILRSMRECGDLVVVNGRYFHAAWAPTR